VFEYWYLSRNSFVDEKNRKSFIFYLGRELRSDQPVTADEVLSCDRTIRNEINKMAEQTRKALKHQLTEVAEVERLCLSLDIWTENYRKFSYLGATAHYVDHQFIFHSIDLFCVEYKPKKNWN
jgi:hypothetical protein